MELLTTDHIIFYEKSVVLTGRNTTGPPCSRGAIIRLEAAWRHRLACLGEAACRPAVQCYKHGQMINDDNRWWQTPATVTSLSPYTMCGRASNQDNATTTPCCVVKERKGRVLIIQRHLYYAWSQSAQAWIAQFYLQITPCLPFLRKYSPDGATSNWGNRHPTAAYYSLIDPEVTKCWVGLVSWPIADGLPT